MTRTRILARFACTMFAASLLVVGVRAAQPPEQRPDDLKDIRDMLAAIERRMANQQATTDVLMEIVRKDLKDLRDDVSRLQRELADARNRTTNPNSSSLYGGTPSSSQLVGPPMAYLRLVNTHAIEMSGFVNGVFYSVPPGQQRTIPVPAGAVNYNVWQVPEPPKMRMLVPNETLTVTLFPR